MKKQVIFVLIILLASVLLVCCAERAEPQADSPFLRGLVTTAPNGPGGISQRFCLHCCGTGVCAACTGAGRIYSVWLGKERTCALCGGSGKCPFC